MRNVLNHNQANGQINGQSDDTMPIFYYKYNNLPSLAL
jgi:hypothetical protein